MSKKEIIRTSRVPQPTAPLSQATRFGNLVFVSGSVGRSPETGELPEGGIKEQARQTLENIKSVLEEAGTSLDNVLKVTCYLKDLADHSEGYWQEYLAELKAANASRLPAIPVGHFTPGKT